jgi:hypothetical protein
MTRDPLDFTETPEWWKIANIPGQSAFSIDISADGDVIYVGTATGRIYTISNVSQARDVQSADVSQGNPVTQITSTIIANGRIVTSIGADPTDNNRAVATLSSYGNQNYVYYSTNAASASPSYQDKTGNLPLAPAYASVVDKADPKRVIVGTEFGIYATENITLPDPQVNWTSENNGLNHSPVFTLVQYRTNKSSDSTTTVEEGDLFLGSYGRGWYTSKDLVTQRPISVGEEQLDDEIAKEAGLSVYPNPASEYTKVDVELLSRGDINVSVIDLSGRTIKQMTLKGMPQGEHSVRVNLDGISNGTYVLSLEANGTTQNAKFIVNK